MALTVIIRYPLSYAVSVNYHPTLKERIIGKDLQVEEPSRHIEAGHPLKYKSWNAENLVTAIAAVQSNKCTVRET